MERADEIQMLRLADDMGSLLVAACIPRNARDIVQVGAYEQWAELEHSTSVVIDTSSIIQVTDPSTISALAAWLSAAAAWLKIQQLRDQSEGEGDDDDVEEDL